MPTSFINSSSIFPFHQNIDCCSCSSAIEPVNIYADNADNGMDNLDVFLPVSPGGGGVGGWGDPSQYGLKTSNFLQLS